MRKKLFLLLEISIWLTLIFSIVFLSLKTFHPDMHVKETYNVEFRDVDGIIIGSPVRFMGLNIGHVRKIKVLKDKVRLELAITEDSFKLPKTSFIKIEASGLGGSRSLELFPSNEIFQSKKILAVEPKRITEVFLSSTDFTEGLVDSMTNMKKVLDVILESEEYKNIDNINKDMVAMKKDLAALSLSLEDKKLKSEIMLGSTREDLVSQLGYLQKIDINKKDIISKSIALRDSLETLSGSLNKYDMKTAKQSAYKDYKKYKKINALLKKIDAQKELSGMIENMVKLQSILAKIEVTLSEQGLDDAKVKVKEIKELTKQLNKRL